MDPIFAFWERFYIGGQCFLFVSEKRNLYCEKFLRGSNGVTVYYSRSLW